MKKQRIPNIATVASVIAMTEKRKKGEKQDVIKRMLAIGIRKKIPPWLFQKLLDEIRTYPGDVGVMVAYYLIEHVMYNRLHHTANKETEERLQRVYKMYDDYRKLKI